MTPALPIASSLQFGEDIKQECPSASEVGLGAVICCKGASSIGRIWHPIYILGLPNSSLQTLLMSRSDLLTTPRGTDKQHTVLANVCELVLQYLETVTKIPRYPILDAVYSRIVLGTG